jgi:multisubunit Na+/H+ antiporter MnhC subunit
MVEWLQHFLRQESNNRRMAYGLAIAGHVIIALVLLLGFFERTEPASVAAMPVEIVMEEPVAASPPPVSAPNEQNGLPSIPAVADADKRAKAPLATLDVNGVDLSKQPGHDGGDPSSDPATLPMPRAAGDLASGAASLPSWAVEPIGLAQRQATARESGEDELTAIKEPKLECGAKARWPSPRARIRKQAVVIGIATAAQALAMTRSSQVLIDRRINPNYATNTEVFADTWEGKTAVLLPAGLTVNVGDVIEFDQGHVDPSNPCQYIPNLAVSER